MSYVGRSHRFNGGAVVRNGGRCDIGYIVVAVVL